jgi:pimeloyl-ACP methyl ester carboxylesterase
MDQPTFAGLLSGFQQRCSAENNLPDLTAFAGRVDAPIVVLIHGIGGNAGHWLDPVSLDVNSTWLFDLDADPREGSGITSSPPYAPGSMTSWCQLLEREQISYVTWSLTRPDDLLAFSVTEAVAVLGALEQQVFSPFEQDVAANGGAVPPLIVLCHSRGGLVTRAALKQLGGAGVPHLRKVITLCTPHRGSYMPRIAADYNDFLSNSMDFSSLGHNLPRPVRFVIGSLDDVFSGLANRVREAMLHSFGTLAQGPGFEELEPDSAMLQALAQDEQPVAGVQYYGFGGSNPTFIDFYLREIGQTFPLLGVAGRLIVEQLARIPDVQDRYGGLEEMDQGDSSVGLSRSQWPEAFNAPHQVFHVNHMQALIDPSLQQAVLETLRA